MQKVLMKKLSKEKLVRLYETEECSLADIAKIYGVSRTAIMKHCDKLEIKRRTKSKSRLLAQQKGKIQKQRYCTINEDFFSSWSSNMAYILGLLITDGCISKTKNGSYRISLCLNDRDLLLKVAKTMGSDHTITESKYQKDINVFIFGREKIARDLLQLGMKPRKSLDVKFPEVPSEYLRDFIRGVFDGDGSVFYELRSKNSPLKTSFTSGSREFICTLEKVLQGLSMPKRVIYESGTTGKPISYMFRYSHKDSLKLFDIMYKNISNQLYMKRKYERFKNTINAKST
ncbi:MAG: hypothetical protein ISS45_07155 [Candidatus Omnitrophica bacterium]|nr:hypothetical protein [Candidatus Omnitrophota bacterium]